MFTNERSTFFKAVGIVLLSAVCSLLGNLWYRNYSVFSKITITISQRLFPQDYFLVLWKVIALQSFLTDDQCLTCFIHNSCLPFGIALT